MSDPKFITDQHGNELARKSSNGSTWMVSDEVANNLRGTNTSHSNISQQYDRYYFSNPSTPVAPLTKRTHEEVHGTIIGIAIALAIVVAIWLFCKFVLVPWHEEHRIIDYSNDIIGGVLNWVNQMKR